MMRRLPSHWRAPLALLAALWLATALLFAGDFAAMAALWWNSSTYNHILLIPPLLVWLVMQRTGQIAPLRPQPWWPGLAAIAAGGFVWLLGDAAGVALLRHLGVVLLLQAAVIAALGPMLTRALVFPLAYALLLVPFGDELLPLFQSITADLSMLILGLTGTPAVRDGIFITTDAGFFEVAEECAGVMFLVAMVAFSALAANLCFTSWWRRIIFMACALGATVIANAIRAAGTILVAEIYGIEYAVGVDHIVYGWFFFAFIMVAIMLVARRWFDRPATAPAVDVRGLDRPFRFAGSVRTLAPAALALLVAPLLWSHVVGAQQGALPARVTLPDVPGWTIGGTPDPVWKARFDGADHFLQRRYTDAAGRIVDVALASYAHQGEGREVTGYGQGAVDPEGGWIRSSAADQMAGAPIARLFHPGPVQRDAATWYVVAGQTAADPRRAKWLTLRARLGGGDPRAAALILSSEQRAGGAAAMRDWLYAAGGVRKVADRATESR
jgi:exosortase A